MKFAKPSLHQEKEEPINEEKGDKSDVNENSGEITKK